MLFAAEESDVASGEPLDHKVPEIPWKMGYQGSVKTARFSCVNTASLLWCLPKAKIAPWSSR